MSVWKKRLSILQSALLALLIPALPLHAEGLSLDDLMGTPAKHSSAGSSPDQLLDSAKPAGGASLDLSDIHAGREQARQVRAVDDLRSQDREIVQRCHCALSSDNCYDFSPRRLNLSQQVVIDAAKKANHDLTEQAANICRSWNGSKNLAVTDMAAIEAQAKLAHRYQGLLDSVEKAADDSASKLRQKDDQIAASIAQQESQSSFDWGKALALGVGAVAGGLGNLDSASQTEILGAIVADSFSGDSSISNLQSTVNSLNAELQQVSRSASPGVQGGQGGGISIDENYSFTCPSGRSDNIRIQAKSQSCAQAMKRYAKAAGCNLIDELESAQQSYYSACASEMYQ
ncbi:MAG: hypothetical protein GYB21_03015 [Oceanospirillales bacterium]|nr:hypothetical protein [Oceanospirillales bacterium]